MCGFIITNNNIKIQNYRKILKHRGPHSSKIYINKNIKIIFNRLSIVDLNKRSNQPMKYGNLIIAFNGEIYNYKKLKKKLSNEGYKFSTTSDTEVLLKLYHKFGKKCLNMIEGMFAFLIYNNTDNSIFVARDAFGIKPLFYQIDNGNFFISSEKKSFFYKNSNKKLNREAVYKYIKYGDYQADHDTFFSNIKSLLPGGYIFISKNKSYFRKWYNIKVKKLSISYTDAKEELKRLLKISVENCLIGDRKIALSCSGGLDSSVIAEISKQVESKNLKYMLHYTGSDENDEEIYARIVNKSLNLNFIKSVFKRNDFYKYLKKSFYSLNEPIGGLNTLNAFKAFEKLNQKKIFVLLDGNGADEILGGYEHHILSHEQKKEFASLPVHGVNYSFDNNLFSNSFKKIKSDITFQNKFTSHTKNLMFNELMGSKVRRNLLQGDHLSMRNSVETRYPYLNKNLVEFCLNLPTKYMIKDKVGKFILRDLFKGKNFKIPKRPLQNAQNKWMRTFILNNLIEEINKDKNFFDYNIFDKSKLIKYLNKKKKFKSSVVEWRILMIYNFLKSNKFYF